MQTMSEVTYGWIQPGHWYFDIFADGEHVYVTEKPVGGSLVLGHSPARGIVELGDVDGRFCKVYGPELRALAREYPQYSLQGIQHGNSFQVYDIHIQGEPVSYQHPAWTHLDWLQIDTAPILYSGPYYDNILEDHRHNHHIIIRPLGETTHPTLGRKILQYARTKETT